MRRSTRLKPVDRLRVRFYTFSMNKAAMKILRLMLVVLALPAGVRGQDYQVAAHGTGITITKYVGAGGAVAVPENINGLPVTTIGMGAFLGSSLTSVTFPPSVTNIENGAFIDCSLASITLPSSIRTIGEQAFAGCANLSSVTIPNSIARIGGGAFSGCTHLQTVAIQSGVTSIGESAFEGCTELPGITLPNSVTNLEASAFLGCTNLASITIPDRVISIGDGAFSGCHRLSTVQIGAGVATIDDAVEVAVGDDGDRRVVERVADEIELGVGVAAGGHVGGEHEVGVGEVDEIDAARVLGDRRQRVAGRGAGELRTVALLPGEDVVEEMIAGELRGGPLVDEFLRTGGEKLRVGAVFLAEGLEGGGPLGELRAGLRLVGGDAGPAGGRNDDRRKNADDRDHGEELDEREAAPAAERLRTETGARGGREGSAHGSLSA